MLRNYLTGLSLIVLLMPAVGFGQEEEVEALATGGNAIVVASSSDQDGVMGTRIMSMSTNEMPDISSLLSGGIGFSADISGSRFSMLNDSSVQKDLQLVDDQLKQIEEINAEFREKMKEKMSGLHGEDGKFQPDLAKDFTSFINDMQKQQEERISNLLLPHQLDRLKQVSRQTKMSRLGAEQALTKHLAEELGISPEQKSRIQKKSKQLQEDLVKKIAELKAKAKEELLQELSKDQRKKLEDLLGDEFVVKKEDRKNGLQQLIDRHKKSAGGF